jgi:hypothetical protein
MPKPLVSESEFIRLWRETGSPTEMSKILNCSERTVYSRRNQIEIRTGVRLESRDTRGANRGESAKMTTAHRQETNRLEIASGVIVIGSDAHYSPGHVPVAHKAMCNLISELGTQVKAIILNGDILDGGSIGRHPRIRFQRSFTVKQELEAIQERVGEIESVRPPGAHLMRTYGNHCARFESRLSAMVPQFEGVSGFTLRDHLPFWTDSNRIDINEDMVVIHDWHAGVHSGWNDVLKGGCHIATGHTHELGFKAHRGFKKTHYGIKTGMLADEWQEEFDYRVGKPGMNWQSGFAVLTWVDGELLMPEFCAVRDNGKAYFRGRLYAD